MNRVEFSPDGETKLIGKLWLPDNEKEGSPIIIFIHPWGILGGSVDNVDPFAEQLRGGGMTSLTFNLRGVRGSGGKSTIRCREEVQDVLGAVKFIKDNHKDRKVSEKRS